MKSSQTRDLILVLCIVRQILKHWTTRKVLMYFLDYDFLRIYAWEWNCWIVWSSSIFKSFFKNFLFLAASRCLQDLSSPGSCGILVPQPGIEHGPQWWKCPVLTTGSQGNSLFLLFQGNSILFSVMAVPIYIPINSEGGFPFLYTLSSICL